jgi:hypothetical protein
LVCSLTGAAICTHGLGIIKLVWLFAGIVSVHAAYVVAERLQHFPAVQQNGARSFYHNIRHAADGSAWQALLWLPGRGRFEVGQHKLQLVAACIADDAAQIAADAGLKLDEPMPYNFAPLTRHMVCAGCACANAPIALPHALLALITACYNCLL